MSQAITTSRIGVIENLFRDYPDAPREIVIKQDLLSLGIGFSDSALAAAAGAEKKAYSLFGDMVPMSGMRRQEYLKVPQFFFVKGGPYKLRPFSMRTKIAASSPYLIDVIDGRLKLRLDGAAIALLLLNTILSHSPAALFIGILSMVAPLFTLFVFASSGVQEKNVSSAISTRMPGR